MVSHCSQLLSPFQSQECCGLPAVLSSSRESHLQKLPQREVRVCLLGTHGPFQMGLRLPIHPTDLHVSWLISLGTEKPLNT